jgi:hypothetical protein
MSFFANAFKRRREGEGLELQSAVPSCALGPATPPTVATAPLAAAPGSTGAAAHDAPAQQCSAPSAEHSARVRAKAAYFEALINGRDGGGSASASDAGGPASLGSDCSEGEGAWWLPAHGTGGDAAAAEAAALAAATIERLRGELARVDLDRRLAQESLVRKARGGARSRRSCAPGCALPDPHIEL